MYTYSVIEIVNVEPLKIGAGGSKANQTEPSKDYIPGSTIRGALIGQLISKGVFKENAHAILSQMACYNAYPYLERCLFLPIPQHMRMDKHIWRRSKAALDREAAQKTIGLTNLLDEGPNKGDLVKNKDKITDKNPLPYRFIALKDGVLAGVKIAKEYRLHHNTSRKLGEQERENLFRYQAIAPKHTFRALIKIETSLFECIVPVLNEISHLYLGGAKGSGYGLCQMRIIEHIGSDYEKAKQLIGMPTRLNLDSFEDTSQCTSIVITCLSDCLCRDEYGQPVNYIPPKVIEAICGEPVSLCQESMYVQTGVSEGYNAKWQARYPKETTLRAGSVLKYQFKRVLSKGELVMIIRALEKQLIGHRTNDGFGWIGVNIPYPKELCVQEVKESLKSKKQDVEKMRRSIHGDEELKQVMSLLVSGLAPAKKRWLNMIFIKSHTEQLEIESDDHSFVLSRSLKSHHLQQMKEMLEEPLNKLRKGQLPKKISNKDVERDYKQDKEQCSIKGYHFLNILTYLCFDEKKQSVFKGSNFDKLTQYAQKMLASKKGQLFYSEAAYQEKLFIAELLDAGLYIQRRREGK